MPNDDIYSYLTSMYIEQGATLRILLCKPVRSTDIVFVPSRHENLVLDI